MILASYDELQKQAGWTIALHLRCAIEKIDDEFGEGYAQDHPQLVSAFIQAATADFAAAVLAVAIQEHATALEAMGETP